MVFIFILAALILYALLYILWQAFGGHIGVLTPYVQSLNHILFLSDDTVFVILRGLILISLAYAIFDFFWSATRRQLRRQKAQEEDARQRQNLKQAAKTPETEG